MPRNLARYIDLDDETDIPSFEPIRRVHNHHDDGQNGYNRANKGVTHNRRVEKDVDLWSAWGQE